MNSLRRSSGGRRFCLVRTAGDLDFFLIAVCFSSKPAGLLRPRRELTESATGEQQRLGLVVSVGFHRTKENYVVAPIISGGGAALERSDGVGEQRRLAESARPCHARELVFRGF